jgi:Asp-tRNA(Asn)/Glu-tRNA(Gln) amidotransferase A subunit family amidase
VSPAAPAALDPFVARDREAAGDGPSVAVKENIAVAGLPRRAGSPLLPSGPCEDDATVVAALRAAGCRILGTTAMHELALGVTGDNSHFGAVPNPAAPDRIAGGSSSGSAAAVAAGLSEAALGTDTGGSVRLPAALCGVVGLKPRREELSRTGVLTLSRSLDAVGVLGRDVATVTEVTGLAAGTDLSSPPHAEPRLGMPEDWLEGVDGDVLEPFLALAATASPVRLPERRQLAEWAGTISLFEAARAFPGFLSGEEVGRDVASLLRRGAAIPEARYEAARRGGEAARRELAEALAPLDALLVPTVPCVAPLRGETPDDLRARLTGWTRPFNLTDSPALSLPLAKSGPPAAIQVVGADTRTVLAVAAALERRMGSD